MGFINALFFLWRAVAFNKRAGKLIATTKNARKPARAVSMKRARQHPVNSRGEGSRRSTGLTVEVVLFFGKLGGLLYFLTRPKRNDRALLLSRVSSVRERARVMRICDTPARSFVRASTSLVRAVGNASCVRRPGRRLLAL